jgi:hypothetical protein
MPMTRLSEWRQMPKRFKFQLVLWHHLTLSSVLSQAAADYALSRIGNHCLRICQQVRRFRLTGHRSRPHRSLLGHPAGKPHERRNSALPRQSSTNAPCIS